MAKWLLVIGIFFFVAAAFKRLQRTEHHEDELGRLALERREARFWGFNTEAVDKAYKAKLAEHRNRKNKVQFESAFWGLVLAGVALCTIAIVIWIDEDPVRTWGVAWGAVQSLLTYMFIGAVALWCIFQLLKRLNKAENDIKWLTYMLRAVNKHAEEMRKVSMLELQDRLDRLEGRPRRSHIDRE